MTPKTIQKFALLNKKASESYKNFNISNVDYLIPHERDLCASDT